MRSIAVCLSAFFFALACATSPTIADEAPSLSEALGSVDAEEGAAPETENPLEGVQSIPSSRGTEETSSIAGNEADPIIPVDRADEVNLERVHAAASRDDAPPSPVSSADPAPASTPSLAQAVAVYRLYNPSSGEHFYTRDAGEKNRLVNAGWYDEGTAWHAHASSGMPVYRLYYAPTGEHHYTTDANERSVLASRGWKAEGILCYASAADGVPVYRQYNPRGGAGAHNFTTSKAENDSLAAGGWRSEGIDFYVASEGVPKAWPTSAPATITTENVYRLYHAVTGEHFYTRNATEKNRLVNAGWYDEGIAWGAPSWSRVPVYRLYNAQLRDHHYTTDSNEVRVLTSRYGWRNEGVGWYSSEDKEVPVYRQFNSRLSQGSHHYTTAKAEYDTNNARNGWRGEGIAWYAKTAGVPKAHPAAPLSTVTAGLTDSSAREMALKAQNYASATNWLILTNESTARVGVFQRSNGRWYLKHYWASGPGAVGSSTIKGQFTIGNRGYSFGSGFTAYYWTQFSGDYLFHSILYYQGTFTVKDGTLGRRVSHGCVRLALENAKWINENIPRGTKVVSY